MLHSARTGRGALLHHDERTRGGHIEQHCSGALPDGGDRRERRREDAFVALFQQKGRSLLDRRVRRALQRNTVARRVVAEQVRGEGAAARTQPAAVVVSGKGK